LFAFFIPTTPASIEQASNHTMMALLMLLLLCCCIGESTAFVHPEMRTLRRFQSVQRFRGGIARYAERDDDIADLKTRTTVLETKYVAVETALDRLERTIKEQGLQMITKMDKLETKIDKLATKIENINLDIKFIPLLNAAVLIGEMMVLAYVFGMLEK
jgi:hypothetical protein